MATPDAGPGAERHESLALQRQSAQSFAAKASPRSRARALRGMPPGFDTAFWSALAAQGWTGLLVPEAQGGYGQGFAEMAEVVAALAGQVAPEPLVPVVVFAGRVLARAEESEAASRLLTGLAEGRTLPAVAWQESETGTGETLDPPATRLDRDGETVLLRGLKRHVRPGVGADGYIVSASGEDGLALVWVPGATPGLAVRSRPLADGSFAAELELSDVSLPADHVLATGAAARAALARARDETLVMAGVELLALVRSMLAMTLDYLRTRVQFGKPIGSFQALQHRAVDLHIQQELTAAVVAQAITLLDSDAAANAAQRAAMAARVKARASDAALLVAREAVQMHGAIGITDEHDLGLYVQRTLVLSAWLGNATQQRRRYAALTGGARAEGSA